MIFSIGTNNNNFWYGTEKVPVIDNYTYLGIPFTNNMGV